MNKLIDPFYNYFMVIGVYVPMAMSLFKLVTKGDDDWCFTATFVHMVG